MAVSKSPKAACTRRYLSKHPTLIYLEACDEWSKEQKRKVIIAVGEAGYSFDFGKDDPDDFEVDIYEVDSLKELAEQFIDEGLYGEIPKAIANYLDYDAIARAVRRGPLFALCAISDKITNIPTVSLLSVMKADDEG